ncbi:11506_t:CDS:1, partial [Acaulospora colombiana]
EEIIKTSNKVVVRKTTEKITNERKKAAVTAIQLTTTPETCKEIVSEQKKDGRIELSETIKKELDIPSTETLVTTVQKYTINEKLKKPESTSWWTTAVNLSYLKNAAAQHEGEWRDKYNKAREYLSSQIGDSDAEKEILEVTDKYVVDKATHKVIEDHKQEVIAVEKEKKEKRQSILENITGGITSLYKTSTEATRDLGKHIGQALTFDTDEHDHQEKAAALIVVQSSTTPEKTKSIVTTQKNDGSFELSQTIVKELDVPAKEVVTTIQTYTTNEKLKKPESASWWKTALTLSYLKNAASQHEKEWRDKYNKAREYLTLQIGDAEAEKELLDTTDKYVVDNVTKKVIVEKKKTAIIAIQSHTTPETVETAISSQKDDGSFEISETITKELDVTSPEDLITSAQDVTKNDKLKYVDASIWKTALTLGYLNTTAPQHENTWKDKYDKAREYLHAKLNNPELEEEIIKTSNKVVVGKTTEKITNEHKKAAVTAIQLTITPETCKEIVSEQKKDGQIELSKTIKKELDIPSTETLVTTVQSYTTNEKLKKPESTSWWTTAVNLSYLKNAAAQHEGEWRDKYNKAREYLSSKIGDADAEKEILEVTDKYVVDKATHKVIEDHKQEVIAIEKEKKEKRQSILENITGGLTSIYKSTAEATRDLGKQIEQAFTFDEDEHDNQEKAAALIVVQSNITPEKTKSIVTTQKNDGSFEISQTIVKELDVPAKEVVTTIQKCTTNEKLKKPESASWWKTALTLSYLKNAASQHEGEWRDKYNKAREYLTLQI